MAMRTVKDENGIQWQVWATWPIGGLEVDPPLSLGWLTFYSAGQRRRLAPIPDGWEELTEPALLELCEAASRTTRQPQP